MKEVKRKIIFYRLHSFYDVKKLWNIRNVVQSKNVINCTDWRNGKLKWFTYLPATVRAGRRQLSRRNMVLLVYSIAVINFQYRFNNITMQNNESMPIVTRTTLYSPCLKILIMQHVGTGKVNLKKPFKC